jgi:outer membrane biosynthesis protein TonB
MSSVEIQDKEQLLEGQLEQAKRRLASAQAGQEEALAVYERLQAKQETAGKLTQISEHMAELAHRPPLLQESPITGETLNDANSINQHYAVFIERINLHVKQYKAELKNAKEDLDSAQRTVNDAQENAHRLATELEKLRPMIRTRTLTRVGSDGVQRAYVIVFRRQAIMPWSQSLADDRRYRRIRNFVILVMLLLGMIMPYVPIPEQPEVVEIPERMARLIQEQKPPPPPPPPKVAEKKPEQEQPKEELKPRKQAPEPKTEVAKAAREKAGRSGLLAFSDSFADLMDNPAEELLGKQARVTSGGATARRTERSLITAAATQGSGGINTAALSRDVAGSGLEGRGTSRVTGVIGDEFGDADRPLAESVRGSRTDEEIQLVFDRNKSALYAIYQRELRKDPTLKGKIVLRITIAPSGKVTASVVESSDLNHPELEQKIATRVKLFDFGAKDVPAITISYPIDFLPA